MKPKENEHITTPQYQLPYSWDKGECLIAVFQTKSTQLRTRVRVKEVLKGNITHSSTVIKEYWNRPQNSISSFMTPSEGGKKSPKPINLLFSGPFLPPFLGLSTSMLVFNLSLLEEAASHFQDSRTAQLVWPDPAWGLCHTWLVSKPFAAKGIYHRGRSIILNPSKHHS